MTAWHDDAVVYQVYPRSFQDSDGDGVGDLPGITARLEHVARLGADAVWLSPIYPSPMADGGYDVADYQAVAPAFGTLADADGLFARAHELGLRVLLDVVPCHTSIEHPWFREHPERYVWSDRDGPRNNWRAAFGGSAWSRDPHGRGWYLHSFYPEQPDLDWRNPDVPAAVGDALRFWLGRGADGFRLDALHRLLKDPAFRDDPPTDGSFPLPLQDSYGQLAHVHSANAPDIGTAVAEIRRAAGDAFLVGEVYLPTAQLGPYLEHVDACFAFELFHARWDADSVRAGIAAALSAPSVGDRLAWVLSNHDFPRLPTRVGARNVRAAALLLLTLPGRVFVYQGDEIGMGDGPGGNPPHDRAGRDRFRHPMQWDASPAGGFTTGAPWLPAIDAAERNVTAQERDPDSILALYRDLIALRGELGRGLQLVDGTAEGVVAYTRGDDHVVALNLAGAARPAPAAGSVLRATAATVAAPGQLAPHVLAPGAGFLATRT
jgi:alpha-glucosidase